LQLITLTEITTSNNNNNNGNNTSSTNGSNVNEQINELNELNKTGNNNQELFTSSFTNNEALQLKNKAESDYIAAVNKGKNSETKLNEIKNSSSASTPDDFATRSNKLNAEIDQLYKEASDLRKEANSLTGNVKADKINKAKEKEALAANKKFELAQLTAKENEAKFELNQKIIDEYIAANGNKNNPEVVKASDLINESSALYKQAIKIEEEANAEQDIAAKAASYSNVEEKELEALTKQEQAIALLKKNNPNFEPKSKPENSSSSNNIAPTKLDEVKKEIQQKNNDINNSLNLLSEANQKEYNTLLNNVSANTSPEIIALKNKAEELKNKAEKEKEEAITLQNSTEKNAKLVNANKLYQEAIIQLNEASKLSAAATNNNNTANNNTATNNNNTGNNNIENNNTSGNNTSNTNGNNNVVNNTSNNESNNTSGNNTSNTNGNNNVVNNTSNNENNNTSNTNGNNNVANNNTPNNNENNTVANNNNAANNTNNENNTNNTATTNTVVPNSGKLSPTEIAKVKESEEYKNFTTLDNDAKKYNDIAIKENDKATAYYNQAGLYLKESNDLRIETDKMPDGEDRKLKLDQAIKLDRLANEYKAKGDSVKELANNTRAFADSKKMESEAYASTLDKKTMDKILAVNDNTANNNANNTSVANNTANNNVENNSASNSTKFDGLSEGFKTNASKLENDLKTFETAEENQANLEAQNQILAKYNGAIDKEITNEKKKLTTANPTQKTAINNRIKSLESQKATNNKSLAANKTKIAAVNANNNVANNTNNNSTTNSNNAANNNNIATNSNNTTSNNNTANNSNNTANNNTVANNNSGSTTNNTNPVSGTGFKVISGNAYSASQPIPIDEKLPAGIIFAVQIGAFKNQIPNDLFKGLSPLRGETTPQGLIRYQAGKFLKFEEANGVKNDLKKLGYKDAFVVVYKDGQKLSVNEAITQLKSNGVNVEINPNETAGITTNSNIPNANTINTSLGVNNNTTNSNPVVSDNGTPPATKELSTTQGMLFTVQIGVYSNSVSASQLYNLKPIYREQIPSGNYRYTAGVYSNIDKVKADRQKVNDLGIKDAFVSAYLNGQRIKIAEALAKIGSGESIQFAQDSPIQFNGGTTTNTIETTPPPANNTAANTNNTTLQPFSNGVTQGPQPTPENGVKIGDEGVTFKVQIGAYKNQVPANVANNFLKIKEWPIQASQINGLYIYSVGSFVDAKSARPLLENAKQNGIADAYITVYKDGKKLYGAAASELLNR
jgi:hypothetical protein